MNIIEIPVEGYETVLQCHDKRSGLQANISVHNTTLGLGIGRYADVAIPCTCRGDQ